MGVKNATADLASSRVPGKPSTAEARRIIAAAHLRRLIAQSQRMRAWELLQLAILLRTYDSAPLRAALARQVQLRRAVDQDRLEAALAERFDYWTRQL